MRNEHEKMKHEVLSYGRPEPDPVGDEADREELNTVRPWRKTGRVRLPSAKDRPHELTERVLRGIPLEQPRTRATPWRHKPPTDQGDTSACTVYSFANFLQAEPYSHLLTWTADDYARRLTRAQAHDGINGKHEGSTERAVQDDAKADGIVSAFLWVADLDIAKEYLLTRGPLIFGSDWFDSMFTPDKHGYVEAVGSPDPNIGHEYMLRWYYGPRHHTRPDTFEFLNSWGEGYGDRGLFRMKGDMFRYLFLQLGGDLVSPIEAARVRQNRSSKPSA